MNTTPITWTEFLPASLPGSSRIHLAEVNPFKLTYSLCGSPKQEVSFVEAKRENSAANCRKCQDKARSIQVAQAGYIREEAQAQMTPEALAQYNDRQDKFEARRDDVQAYRDAVAARVGQIVRGTADRDAPVYPAGLTFPQDRTNEDAALEAGATYSRSRDRETVEFPGRRVFTTGVTRVQYMDDFRLVRAGRIPEDDMVTGTVHSFEPILDGIGILVTWDGFDTPGATSFHPSQLRIVPAPVVPQGEAYWSSVRSEIEQREEEEAEGWARAEAAVAHEPESRADRWVRIVRHLDAQQRAREADDAAIRAGMDEGPRTGKTGTDLLSRIDAELDQVKDQAKNLEAWAVDANGTPFIPGVTRVRVRDEEPDKYGRYPLGDVVQSGRGHVHVIWHGDPTGASFTYAATELVIMGPNVNQDPRSAESMTPEERETEDEEARTEAQDSRRAGIESLGVPIHRNPFPSPEEVEEARRARHRTQATPNYAETPAQMWRELETARGTILKLKRALAQYQERQQELEDLLTEFKSRRNNAAPDTAYHRTWAAAVRELARVLRLPES